MNKKTIIKTLAIALIATFAVQSCKDPEVKPDDQPKNEGELITTVILKFTDSTDNSVREFKFKDTDGEGGNAPSVFDTIKLKASSTYSCSILLLDESKSETDTISNEVLEEADEHLFYFTKIGVDMDIIITDKDGNNLPLGLQSKWKTKSTGTGIIELGLKHQPGAKDGSVSPGETDIEIGFHIRIE